MSRDTGWEGKWVNGWGRWNGSLGESLNKSPSCNPTTHEGQPTNRPTLWIVENGKAIPLVRDKRLGFKP